VLTTTEPPQKRHSTKCGMSPAVVLVLASPARVDFNRMTTATVTPAGGSAITLVSNTYDGYVAACAGATGMVARTGAT
jgi:hypothetical protein